MKSGPNALSPAEQDALFKSIDNVQRAAVQHLSAHQSGAFAISYIANLQRGIDRVVQTAIDRSGKIECRAGCSYCCNAKVETSAPEVFRIAQEVLSRPTEEIDEITKRLRARAKTSNGMLDWKQRAKCPFLKDSLCSIYEIRPSSCRKAHSLDVRECVAGADEIPQSLDIVLAAEALIEGTLAGYRQCGFDASRHELVAAVLLSLSDPTAESRWLNGEAVFECGPEAASGSASREVEVLHKPDESTN